jgi:hypothetical protein
MIDSPSPKPSHSTQLDPLGFFIAVLAGANARTT